MVQQEFALDQPEVLTLSQFIARGGYDCDMSHDRLRFPHGVSKRQERDNRKAARHHLGESFRAMSDFCVAVEEGRVRLPTDAEMKMERMASHPDSDATKASWRVTVKRAVRATPGLSELDAVVNILRNVFGGVDPWAVEFGLCEESSIQEAALARLRWMRPSTV